MLRALLVTIVACTSASASEDDATLRYFLSRSSLVVSATIVDHPVSTVSEEGVVNYNFQIRVMEVLKGKKPADDLRIELIRFEDSHEDKSPFLKQGKKVILFLRKGISERGERQSLIGADMWFALQPFNRAMSESLKRIAADK